MKQQTIEIQFKEYDNLKNLIEDDVKLLLLAEKNLKNAYAPYSDFQVSSVCEMENGEMVVGTNQENAAYPSGLCAERVAIFSAKSQYPDQKVNKIVITTAVSNDTPFSPCGGCRQVLMEYEQSQNQPIEVILKSGDSKIWKFKSVADLLPFAFNGGTILKKG
ncbi:MAG: cytidine deaminase [Vicingaceae bacterium]|nr:cytidine deaminase [Vicingaceae bacterium]